jgi:hypothetical protein
MMGFQHSVSNVCGGLVNILAKTRSSLFKCPWCGWKCEPWDDELVQIHVETHVGMDETTTVQQFGNT